MSGLWILARPTCMRVYPTCKSLDIRCIRTLIRNFAVSYMNFDCILLHSTMRIDEIIEGLRFSRFHGSLGKFGKIVGWRPHIPRLLRIIRNPPWTCTFFVLNM